MIYYIFFVFFEIVLVEATEKENGLKIIKSTYRLPTGANNEPVTEPYYYNIDLVTFGLKEQDRNENGYFDFVGISRIYTEQNIESFYIVLHIGNVDGYEIVQASVKRRNRFGNWVSR